MISKKNFIITISTILILFLFIGTYMYFGLTERYKTVISDNNNLISDKNTLIMEVNKIKDENYQNISKIDENSKEYKNEIDLLKQQLSDKQKELDKAPKLDKLYIDIYRGKNLSDPQKNIIEDLIRRTDLIPEKAVLGGVMKIENVALLSPDYAYATFSDGHILGHMILKFNISNDGNIDWKILHYVNR